MLKASLIGNLGNDPEIRYSTNGAPYLRFNLAANGRVKAQDGSWQDETTWVRITVTGQRAESLSQYLKKGSKVFVSGRLEARPWTGQNGSLNAGLEVMADDLEFFSPREDSGRAPAGPVKPLGVAARAQACPERSRGDDQTPF